MKELDATIDYLAKELRYAIPGSERARNIMNEIERLKRINMMDQIKCNIEEKKPDVVTKDEHSYEDLARFLIAFFGN